MQHNENHTAPPIEVCSTALEFWQPPSQVMGGGLRQLKMSATPHNMQSALERAQKTGELSTHIEGVLQISNPGSQGIKTEVNGTTDKVMRSVRTYNVTATSAEKPALPEQPQQAATGSGPTVHVKCNGPEPPTSVPAPLQISSTGGNAKSAAPQMRLATTIFAAPFGRGFWYKRPQTLDEAYANVMWAKKTLGKESLLSCLTLISDGNKRFWVTAEDKHSAQALEALAGEPAASAISKTASADFQDASSEAARSCNSAEGHGPQTCEAPVEECEASTPPKAAPMTAADRCACTKRIKREMGRGDYLAAACILMNNPEVHDERIHKAEDECQASGERPHAADCFGAAVTSSVRAVMMHEERKTVELFMNQSNPVHLVYHGDRPPAADYVKAALNTKRLTDVEAAALVKWIAKAEARWWEWVLNTFQRRLSEDARAIWAGRLGTQPQPVGRACPAKSATPVAQQTQQQTKKGLFQWVNIKLCCGGPKTLP